MIVERYALSPVQQGMLFHHTSDRHSGVDIEQLVVDYHEPIDFAVLQSAWQLVAEKHSVLRTSFRWEDTDEPVQEVHDRVSISIKHSNEPLDEASWNAYLAADRRQGFDMTTAPLMRLMAFKLGSASWRLLWTFHHILMDGRSFVIVLDEVQRVYHKLLSGENVDLGPGISYGNYISWLEGLDLSGASEFWRGRLRGFTAPTPLAYGRDVQVNDGASYGQQSTRLPANVTSELRSFVKSQAVTLNTLVMAAWALLLSRYNSEQDIVFGATKTTRRSGLDNADAIVGLLLVTVPIRVQLEDNLSVAELLKRLRAEWTAIRPFEHTPLVKIKEASEVPPSKPLFESFVMFDTERFDSALRKQELWHNCEFQLLEQTNYPLALGAHGDSELLLTIDYDARRYEAGTIRRMLGHLRTLLESMMEDPLRDVGHLPILTKFEEQQILVEWNNTRVDYPLDRCLHQFIEDQVARTPDAPALVAGGKTLSYRELNSKANKLAHYLRQHGVGPDVLVGVCMERSVEMVVALLGTIKAGGAYLPVDPEYPADRLTAILDDAVPPVILTQQHLVSRIPATSKAIRVLLDTEWSLINDEAETNPPLITGRKNLAYAIYTSGSTGKPKGVPNVHEGIVNRLLWMQDAYKLDSTDRVLQKTPFSFDVSVWEFFWPLMTGACLVMARPGGHKDPAYLLDIILQQKITTLHFVPSMLQVFLEVPGLARATSIKRVIVSGEALPVTVQDRFFEQLGAELHNLYGPTEAAVDVTYWACRRDEHRSRVPIGRPIANIQIYLLDPFLNPVPAGVAGELHIGGVGLARGYLNRPELTAEAFIPNPFSSDPTARLYKTGDLCRWTPDGVIDYLGRIDSQVKLRGFRIELGEIEAVCRQHPAIREAAVVVNEAQPGDKKLVCYIVPDRLRAGPLRRIIDLTSERENASRRSYELPNGMALFPLNKTETQFQYEEIFEHQSYLKYGIRLAPGSCVFDVGANVGMFTLFVHEMCPSATVYSFEPIPPVYELLRLNTEVHEVRGKVFNSGLSDSPGTAEFAYFPHISIISGQFANSVDERRVVKQYIEHDSKGGAASDSLSDAAVEELLDERLRMEHVRCDLTTVSKVIRDEQIQTIDLLKIDVEKGEERVLAGIEPEHWDRIRQIVIEVHDIEGRLDRIASALVARGYEVHTEEDSSLQSTGLYQVYATRHAVSENPVSDNSVPDPVRATVWSSGPRLVNDVRAFLKQKLPDYMVPADYVLLNELPISRNGKIDRKALPAPDQSQTDEPATFVSPRTLVEEQIAGIWAEVLKRDRVGVTDDFFEIGGHSLSAMQVLARIRNSFATDIPLDRFFDRPTVESVAIAVNELGAVSYSEDLEQLLAEIETTADEL